MLLPCKEDDSSCVNNKQDLGQEKIYIVVLFLNDVY